MAKTVKELLDAADAAYADGKKYKARKLRRQAGRKRVEEIISQW